MRVSFFFFFLLLLLLLLFFFFFTLDPPRRGGGSGSGRARERGGSQRAAAKKKKREKSFFFRSVPPPDPVRHVPDQQAPRPLRDLADDPEIYPVEGLARGQQVSRVRVSVDKPLAENLTESAGDGGVDRLLDVDAGGLELRAGGGQLDAALDPRGRQHAPPCGLPVHLRHPHALDVRVEALEALGLPPLGDEVELGKDLGGELVDEGGQGLGREGAR